MKNILKKQILWAIPLAFSLLTSSCSDYLDKLPENTVEVEGIDYTNINPEKRNVMVVKNEMRFFYQKRNVLQI